MAALTKPRNTARLGAGEIVLGSIDAPLKANAKVFQGGMVALDLTSGFYVAASALLGLVVVGRYDSDKAADQSLDNAGGANGAKTARVEQGIFRYLNGDTITAAHRGMMAYVIDDQTVAKGDNAGARPAAGRIIDVDASGVFVAMGLQLATLDDILRGSAEQVAANGALAVGKRTTVLTVSGTKVYTMAAGLYVGQRKTIHCKSAVSTPSGGVTVTGGNGFTTLTFAAAPTSVELENGTSGWDVVGVSGTVTIA